MKQFIRRVRQVRRAFFDIRIGIALAGLALSIVLHELVHILVHAGAITHITFFKDGALIEMTALVEPGYTTHVEEAVGYAITFTVLVATIACVAKLSDRKDTRSFSETLIPRHSPLRSLSQKELYELASRVHIL